MSELLRRQALKARLNKPGDRDALIRAYVHQQLNAEQAVDFEILLMEDYSLLDDVEAEVSLRQALQADQEEAAPARAAEQNGAGRQRHWRNPASWMTLAAGIVVGAGVPLLNGRNAAYELGDNRGAVNAVHPVQVATIPSMRSASNDEPAHVIELTAGVASIVVQWAAPMAQQELRVRVGSIPSGVTVQADETSGTVSVAIATDRLKPGVPMAVDLECLTPNGWNRCGRQLLLSSAQTDPAP
jgi:hypothetical protein